MVFVARGLQIAERAHVDLNVDGGCNDPSCFDNRLRAAAPHANGALSQAVLEGLLLLVEVAGLDTDYQGFDRSVTLKLYLAQDADGAPSNNFLVPSSHECCAFVPRPGSLDSGGGGQAIARIPARIRNEALEFVGDPALEVQHLAPRTATVAEPEYFDIVGPWVNAKVSSDGAALGPFLLGGAVRARSLARLESPCVRDWDFCSEPASTRSSLLDQVATWLGSPDVDVDGDGAECIFDADRDGLWERCCDGVGVQNCRMSCERPTAPIDPERPATCALATGFDDAYSFAFELDLVPARIEPR